MRIATTALAALLAASVIAACDDGDEGKAAAASTKACGSDVAAAAATPFPSDLPAPRDFRAYSFTQAGATRVWSGTTAGDRDSLVRTRDTVVGLLEAAGYAVPKKDGEQGIEAEAEFAGRHDGTVKVQVACQGKLRLRYLLER